MRKTVKAILIAALLAVLFLIPAGCGLTSDERAPELVGTWFWDNNPNWVYVFNENGTGEYGCYGNRVPFTWNTYGSEVMIRCGGDEPMFGVRTRVWIFSVVGYSLRLVCPVDYSIMYDYTYHSVIGELEPALVGTWLYNGNPNWAYTFNEDGTGIRGIYGNTLTFVWGVTGNNISIRILCDISYYYFRNELWYFTVTDDTFRLESVPEQGESIFYYTRAGFLGDVKPELVGTWAWIDGIQWVYVFNADGTGSRGWIGESTPFNWGVVDNVIRLDLIGALPVDATRHHQWIFSKEGDVLTLEWKWGGSVYVYIRDAGVGEVNPDLVGIWKWEFDYGIRYVFNEDGTGALVVYGIEWEYGIELESIGLVWGTVGDVLRILPWTGSEIRSYEFVIYRDYLLIECRRFDSTYLYIRYTPVESEHIGSRVS